jgi:hypothetical protein
MSPASNSRVPAYPSAEKDPPALPGLFYGDVAVDISHQMRVEQVMVLFVHVRKERLIS